MKIQYIWKKNFKIIYLLFLILLIILIAINGIDHIYGSIIFEDEYGYWLHAANFAGYKWTVPLNTWYSFGYSIFLWPLYCLKLDSIIIYRVAVILNIFFLLLIFSVIVKISEELFPNQSFVIKYLIAFLTTTYSSYIIQAKTAWSETLIYLWVWLLIYIFIKALAKESRFTLLSIYIGTVIFLHNRLIVFTIAYFIVLILMVFNHNKSIIFVIKQFALCLFVILLYFLVKKAYLSGFNILSSSGYGLLQIIENLFNGDHNLFYNIFCIIISIIGQIWYQLVATFAISFVGIAYSIKYTHLTCCKYKYIYFYTLITTGITYIMTSVYFNSQINDILNGSSDRFDFLVYGRYGECILGFFIFIGLQYIFLNNKKTLIYNLYGIILLIVLTIPIYKIYFGNVNYLNPFCVPGITFTFKNTYNPITVTMISSTIAFIILLLQLISLKKLEKKHIILFSIASLICVCETYVTIVMQKKYIQDNQATLYLLKYYIEPEITKKIMPGESISYYGNSESRESYRLQEDMYTYQIKLINDISNIDKGYIVAKSGSINITNFNDLVCLKDIYGYVLYYKK